MQGASWELFECGDMGKSSQLLRQLFCRTARRLAGEKFGYIEVEREDDLAVADSTFYFVITRSK